MNYGRTNDHLAAPAIECLATLHGQLLERIKGKVLEWAGEVDLLGMYGSAARRDGDESSDIDLLVILDDNAPSEQLTLAAGYAARQSYRHAADVIPCRESVYRRKSRIAGSLAYHAAADGVVVYERA